MPWLSTDKEKIRKFLGFPVQTRAIQNIQDRMDDVQTISPDSVTTAQEYLTTLTSINTAVNSGRDTAAIADLANTSATSYFRGENLKVQREEGQRIARELAELLGLVVYRDVFAVSNQSQGRRVRS